MNSGIKPRAGRRERWEKALGLPLAVAGFAFVVSYSLYVLVENPDPLFLVATVAVLVLSWLFFIVEYVVRILLSPRGDHWRYIRSKPLDLLAVVLPVFRAIRVVHLMRTIPVASKHAGTAVRTRIIVYGLAYTVTFIYFMSLTTLAVERGAPDARITNFGDAIWWAFETISTVGYGDMYPVTGLGRFYAVLLMMGGIVIVGVTSGTLVSYIGEKIRLNKPEGESPDPHGSAERSR